MVLNRILFLNIVVNAKVRSRSGRVIIPGEVNVWPHEYKTALALAKAGYTVEFIRKSDQENETSADVVFRGLTWEMKCPRSGKLNAVERNLKRARRQADNVVFDSRRMKAIPDKAIERELIKHMNGATSIQRLLFINRHGNVIHIK